MHLVTKTLAPHFALGLCGFYEGAVLLLYACEVGSFSFPHTHMAEHFAHLRQTKVRIRLALWL